jgi:hypothetical protein
MLSTKEDEETLATDIPLNILFALPSLMSADGVPVYSVQFVQSIDPENPQT